MGPCFMSTEDLVAFDADRLGRLASMGPCFMSTEDKIVREELAKFDSRFNGAVLHEHGRPLTVLTHDACPF